MQDSPKRSPRHHVRSATEIKPRQWAAAGPRQHGAVRRPREAHAVVRRDETQQAACDAELAVVPQARRPSEEDHEVVDRGGAEKDTPKKAAWCMLLPKGGRPKIPRRMAGRKAKSVPAGAAATGKAQVCRFGRGFTRTVRG